MTDEGNYAAYLTEERDFWHLTVLEAPAPRQRAANSGDPDHAHLLQTPLIEIHHVRTR